MKTIGLIGGMSPESTVHYYRLINRAVHERLGGHHNAKSVIASVDFGELVPLQEQERWTEAGALLADCARRLEAAGADIVAITANTMHLCFEAVVAATRLPVLHIGTPLGSAARAGGLARLGLLGTRYTMARPFLADHLRAHHGIDTLVPDAAEQDALQRIIYDELVRGRIGDASRERLLEVIGGLAQQGAQGIILGCTELGMILRPSDTTLPLLDTTALHARALADFALAR